MPKGIGYGKDTRESKRQAFIESMRTKTKAKPRKKMNKLIRRVKELIGGSKTYLPKSKDTIRTKAVSHGLSKAGITAKETARLRRRKR